MQTTDTFNVLAIVAISLQNHFFSGKTNKIVVLKINFRILKYLIHYVTFQVFAYYMRNNSKRWDILLQFKYLM